METVKRLFISLIVLLGCSAGAWAIEQDSDGYYLIGSVQDWKDFAAVVATTNDAKAKMIADIDLGDDQTTIGHPNESPSYHFKGVFDGQGYTLTVHYVKQGEKDICSPFPNISNATIKNIHITGTIESSTACQPAAIGCVRYGTSTIENVWSSVELTSTKSSWCEASGLVGCVDGYKNGHLVMANCMVSGNIKSSGSYEGCFIGFINSGGLATVSNCLSVANFEYSGTSGFMGNYTNCYVKQFPSTIPSDMRVTDEKIADGTIAAALGDAWVQDAVTGQPMLKIFTTMRQDEEGYYLIGSVTDWKRFAAIVETTPNANAKMIRDVDLGDDQTKIGDDIAYTNPSTPNASNPYKGTFDGQGHTLTVNYTTETGKFPSPFPNIEGATIKNLHVAGSIVSTTAHAGGVVSASWGTDVIENVWVSATISSTGQSWDECGAIVACMKKGTLTLKDCIFTGSMTSTRSYNGCFVGYCNAGTTAIDNCLSTGTFSYGGANITYGNITHTNCYVKQFPASIPATMQVTDEQIADGTTTIALQAGRAEEIWVQDPELGIPMLKIFATPAVEYFLIGSLQDWKDFAELVETEPTTNGKLIADVDLGDDQTMVGSMESPYRGIFDGQGYTLTVNYDMNLTTSAVAPFAVVGDAVIQKLHVAGSIKQQYCAAGGVVGSIMGNVTIKECWVSAYMYVQGYGNLQGTIGGIASCCDNSAARNCSILIEDCVFSGEMATGYHCGSIMSHVNGYNGNSAVIRNCLAIGTYVSPSGSTGTFTRVGTQGDPYTIDNCYYKTSWGAVQGTQATETQLSDGTTADALGDAWAQDPVLGIPMLKIFANEETEQPSDALNGVFTINASGEKVSFSKGNLQKIGSTYQFAEHQYDYFGKNQSDTQRDMFSFNNFSTPNSDDNWFNMTHDQWVYLLRDRSVNNSLSDGACFTMATLGGTYKGVILFPDNYTHPEGTGFTPGVFNSYSNYTAQVSLEGWALMEAAGCVFLPSCGWKSKGNEWKSVGETAVYSSTTVCSDDVTHFYTPCFYVDRINFDGWCHRESWAPVRLVMRLQPLTYTVPSSGVGTFSSEVNIHLPEGLNAHYCKTYYAERSAISVVNISSGVVPANTGVLLSGTPGETFNLYPTPETAEELEGNALVAVVESQHIAATDGDHTNFMMSGGKFIRIADDGEDVKMPANRAYLPLLTEVVSGSNAKEIMLYWGTTTGIESLASSTPSKGEGSIYNLNGQKLSSPLKGINIINGRKVIVK